MLVCGDPDDPSTHFAGFDKNQVSPISCPDNVYESLTAAPSKVDVRMQQLTDLAVRAGTAPADPKKVLKPPAYSEIVREAGALNAMGSGQAEAVWSGCSSLAHGDVLGMLSILDGTIEGGRGDGALTKITSSPRVLHWATDLTVAMPRQGFDLFKDRATCHR